MAKTLTALSEHGVARGLQLLVLGAPHLVHRVAQMLVHVKRSNAVLRRSPATHAFVAAT